MYRYIFDCHSFYFSHSTQEVSLGIKKYCTVLYIILNIWKTPPHPPTDIIDLNPTYKHHLKRKTCIFFNMRYSLFIVIIIWKAVQIQFINVRLDYLIIHWFRQTQCSVWLFLFPPGHQPGLSTGIRYIS